MSPDKHALELSLLLALMDARDLLGEKEQFELTDLTEADIEAAVSSILQRVRSASVVQDAAITSWTVSLPRGRISSARAGGGPSLPIHSGLKRAVAFVTILLDHQVLSISTMLRSLAAIAHERTLKRSLGIPLIILSGILVGLSTAWSLTEWARWSYSQAVPIAVLFAVVTIHAYIRWLMRRSSHSMNRMYVGRIIARIFAAGMIGILLATPIAVHLFRAQIYKQIDIQHASSHTAHVSQAASPPPGVEPIILSGATSNLASSNTELKAARDRVMAARLSYQQAADEYIQLYHVPACPNTPCAGSSASDQRVYLAIADIAAKQNQALTRTVETISTAQSQVELLLSHATADTATVSTLLREPTPSLETSRHISAMPASDDHTNNLAALREMMTGDHPGLQALVLLTDGILALIFFLPIVVIGSIQPTPRVE